MKEIKDNTNRWRDIPCSWIGRINIYIFLNYLIYSFLAALGIFCCTWAFSGCGAWASHHRGSSCCGARALGTRAPAVVACSLSSCGARAQQLWLAGSKVQAQQLWRTGPAAPRHVGPPPDQGSNPCPLHRQADSQPLHHWGSPGRINILKMTVLCKQSIDSKQYLSNYQRHFSQNQNKKFLQFVWKQKTLNSQSNLEKEKWSWRNQAPGLQIILQSYSNQGSIVLAQKQKYRSMEQDRKPRDKSTCLWSPNL